MGKLRFASAHRGNPVVMRSRGVRLYIAVNFILGGGDVAGFPVQLYRRRAVLHRHRVRLNIFR